MAMVDAATTTVDTRTISAMAITDGNKQVAVKRKVSFEDLVPVPK